MKFLTRDESAAWAKQRGYPLASHEDGLVRLSRNFNRLPFHSALFPIPTDSGRKSHLAKSLYSLVGDDDEILLWIDHWAIWPSSQHPPLFSRLRQSFGTAQSLDEAPGQLLAKDEADDAISIILVALIFIWDCHILTSSGRLALYVSHDEYGWIASHDQLEVETARKQLPK